MNACCNREESIKSPLHRVIADRVSQSASPNLITSVCCLLIRESRSPSVLSLFAIDAAAAARHTSCLGVTTSFYRLCPQHTWRMRKSNFNRSSKFFYRRLDTKFVLDLQAEFLSTNRLAKIILRLVFGYAEK